MSVPLPTRLSEPHAVIAASFPQSLAPRPSAAGRSLYPDAFMLGEGYPTEEDFVVARQEDGKGLGVYTKRAFPRGYRICLISGVVVHEVMQHTLQISPDSHLYDPYFTGFLLHSCDPNCFLDMARFELWAIKDIAPGEALTMDYASTEDVLFKQFPCLCGAPNCRKWISGRREPARMPAIAE
ncbi:MAG TPA: SET domain-containing protein-lysine N-methyltransferase [Azospirillaceae bacterium]|nr:SET domain-containing protein-lysine N-methyltransferase [Azospirillaceae bacterium]